MLSDEEKELIEKIQNGNKIGIYELIRTFKREGIENFITVRRKYIDIMINLIEKQSKEIEELKQEKEYLNCIIESDKDNYINKDKIKAKIEEYEQDVKDFEEYWSKDPRKFKKEKSVDYYKLEALQSLLEKE